MTYVRILFALLGMAFLTACVSVRDSEQFYHPLTLRTYPAKPEKYSIPILAGPPKEKFEVIGRMSFSSGHGNKYMMECLRYNARRAGADAVILADSKTTEHPYSYYVPGYTTQQPVTSYSNASANFYGSGGFSGYGTAYGTSTSYVPVYHEGYSAQGVIFRTQIDAYMIRLK